MKQKKARTKTDFVVVRGTRAMNSDNDWVWFARMQLAAGELTDERFEQIKKFSVEHDDKHSLEDWADIIRDRAETLELNTDSKKLMRKYLKQVGALCVAALESMNRKEEQRGRKKKSA